MTRKQQLERLILQYEEFYFTKALITHSRTKGVTKYENSL